jgi:hypothetical protein
MSPGDPARLVIELDLETEAIAGRLGSPAAGARRFAGWLELIAAVEQARAAELQADSTCAGAAGANRVAGRSVSERYER